MPNAVRVRTSSGWQDIALTGPTGATGADSEACGTIKTFAGKVIPNNWMLCDGRAISRTTYADLFAALGTMFGAGDGSTTFNIPDLRNRMVYGASDPNAQGGVGGAATHTLSAAEMPSHQHIHGSEGLINVGAGSWQALYLGSPGGWNQPTNAAGGGAAHNNLPPYILVAQIIKVVAAGVPAVTGFPVGAPIPWVVAAIPSGFREFDGTAIVQATHPILYGLFGATIPDLRGRFLLGVDGTHAIGTTGGEFSHLQTVAEMPSHRHQVLAGGGGGQSAVSVPANLTQAYQDVGNPANPLIQNTGGGAAFNVTPPYRTVRWITVAG